MRKQLSLIQPDDWHLHLRDGELLKQVLPYTSRHFRRAIIMPNLDKPVTHTLDAQAYRQRILQALPAGHSFEPLMTLYLTEHTEATDVESGYLNGTVSAVKLYPAGATTNSASGVRTLEKTFPVLSVMEKIGMPLLIHGEVVDTDVDIFDREAVFIERTLIPLRQHFPELKIVFEHITTAEGVDYVQSANGFIAATITPHHLVINRNALFQGGIRPDYYCLPIAKRERHRKALCDVATSGHSRFFLGTDSAPHFSHAKHSACGCAGIFNAANAISVVTQVFENAQALDKLEGFLSINGANFYGLPVNEQRIVLKRSDLPLSLNPAQLVMAEGKLSIFDPMIPIYWQVSG